MHHFSGPLRSSELRAMLRVVVKPLFSKADGCIGKEIPVLAVPRSFRRIDGKRNRENADSEKLGLDGVGTGPAFAAIGLVVLKLYDGRA